MKNINIKKILVFIILIISSNGKSQISNSEKCDENLNFKEVFFKNIQIVDSLIYQIQDENFNNSLKFISKYAHVSFESKLNYARIYPGGVYEKDRIKWINWYEENKCKNIQFKKIKNGEIIIQNGLAYDNSTNQKFSGIAQTYNKNGLKLEEFFKNGILTKTKLYYNINDAQIVSDETIFNLQTCKKSKHLRFSSDGRKYWETKFDENEKKSEFNSYEDGNLILHEEFKNGKKNGIWFCYNDDGSKCETEYSNGKKIKDCR